LEASTIAQLFDRIAGGEDVRVAIDLAEQTVVAGDQRVSFEITEQRKHSLLNGLDEIGVTLSQTSAIRDFEQNYKQRRPWTFLRD
jgi:3-isopropylmalate/(R)-2-methylmalate dehydratase small subunit